MEAAEKEARIWEALDGFQIELPSWGFTNSGTRFGIFVQPGAASTIEEKFADVNEVHRLTGVSPTIALNVTWDLPEGGASVSLVQQLEKQYGIRAGSISPNLFGAQEYKYGSICNPESRIRQKALDHIIDSVQLGKALGSRDISIWAADGSNYPGTQSIRRRIGWMQEALSAAHASLGPSQRMLIEYKPFEPALYHTDLADWAMALEMAYAAGSQAKVLVDTGHHYQSQNIEQIVAWLLNLNMLGGFHFNDRCYADDDLTLGSIDPYQIFRIFHEILSRQSERGLGSPIAYMVDQSHNLKGKIEAMVQTVVTAQEIYVKAALVDRDRLGELQQNCKLVEAEECFRSAFWEDVRPWITEWRRRKEFPEDPLQVLAASGYVERIIAERSNSSDAAALHQT